MLFQPANSSAWACRECLHLSYRARQQHRVKKPAFQDFRQRHPLFRALQQWQTKCSDVVPKFRQDELVYSIENAIFTEFWAALTDEQRSRYVGGGAR